MKPSIENVRELAAKNAAMLENANQSNEKILDAAEIECNRLSKLIEQVDTALVLTNDDEAKKYQDLVLQRAKLQRLLSERYA